MKKDDKRGVKNLQSYDRGRLMMEAYVARVKAGQSVKTPLHTMINAKTNIITRYI